MKSTIISAKVILKWKNNIFIMKHPEGIYDFPGGRIEFGELPINTLQRELHEELSYTLKEEPSLFDIWSYTPAKDKHIMLIYFIVELTKRPKFNPTKELRTYWFTKQQFISKNIIKDRCFLDKVFRWRSVSYKNFNTVNYWNKVYGREVQAEETSQEFYHRNYNNVFKKIIELIPDGSYVLDVGCGPGILCRSLKLKKPQTKVVGLDFSDYVINRNKTIDKKLGIRYIHHDIRKPFPFSKKFDAIIMTEVLEHLKKPEQVLSNLLECLKLGGIFILSCPHDNDAEHWMKKYHVGGEHLRVWTHDDIFHLLANYSDEVRFIKLKPLRQRWIEWHIFAYIYKNR